MPRMSTPYTNLWLEESQAPEGDLEPLPAALETERLSAITGQGTGGCSPVAPGGDVPELGRVGGGQGNGEGSAVTQSVPRAPTARAPPELGSWMCLRTVVLFFSKLKAKMEDAG